MHTKGRPKISPRFFYLDAYEGLKQQPQQTAQEVLRLFRGALLESTRNAWWTPARRE